MSKDYSKEIDELERSIKNDPKNAELYDELGNLYNEIEEYLIAKKYYLEAIKLDSLNYIYWNSLGNSLYNLGQYSKAISCYKKAISKNKDNKIIINNLADSYIELKSYNKGIKYFKEYSLIKGNCFESVCELFIIQFLLSLGKILKKIPREQKEVILRRMSKKQIEIILKYLRRYPELFNIIKYIVLFDLEYLSLDFSVYINPLPKYRYLFELYKSFGKIRIDAFANDLYLDTGIIIIEKEVIEKIKLFQERVTPILKYLTIVLRLYNNIIIKKSFKYSFTILKPLINKVFGKKIREYMSEFLYTTGNSLEKDGLNEDAIELYNGSLKINPKNMNAINGIILTLDKENRNKDILNYIESFLGDSFPIVKKVVKINNQKYEQEKQIIELQKEREKAEAKLEEREAVFSNIAHDMKNIIGPLINAPLINMNEDQKYDVELVNKAIKGTRALRGIIDSINKSNTGNINSFIEDIFINKENQVSIKSIIIRAFKISIYNIFDSALNPSLSEQYFNKKYNINKKEVLSLWKTNEYQNNKDLTTEALSDFTGKYLFNLKLNINDVENLFIGDKNWSTTKLLIFFNEIVFNAIKYVSFVNKKERFINIEINVTDDFFIMNIENNFVKGEKVKSTGYGKLIINNFLKLLDGDEAKIEESDGLYKVEIKFKNIWKRGV